MTTSIVYRTCDECGVTSATVPIYQVGDGWLCGPTRCAVPAGAPAIWPWNQPTSGEAEG